MNGVPADDYVDDSTIQPLPQDYETPFSPSKPVSDEAGGTPEERAEEVQKLDSTHPSTDTNIQPEEVYEEGLPGAAEAAEPNVADTVESYDPANDLRRKPAS